MKRVMNVYHRAGSRVDSTPEAQRFFTGEYLAFSGARED